MKDVFFIDLDNTVMFTKAYESELMAPLYQLMENLNLGISRSELTEAKKDLLRQPFQKVAEKYRINEEARQTVIDFLQQAAPVGPIKVHDEYPYIRALKGRKFLVTAGFTKMQRAKVELLGINNDFEEVIVVDNTISAENKKDVFERLIDQYQFSPGQVLVIGDDAGSEIKYGLELGLETFLFDKDDLFPGNDSTYRSKTLALLKDIV